MNLVRQIQRSGLALAFGRPVDPVPGQDNYEIRLRVAELRKIRQNQALAQGNFPWLNDPLTTIYQHQSWDEWWQQRTWYRFADQIKTPTYISSQWNDPVLDGSTRMFTEWPTPKKLIVADNNHCAADFHLPRLRWFDYHLKGINNGIMTEPRK